MVVNLAVEDDYGIAVIAAKRLIAGFEVQDLKAGGAQRTGCGLVNALLIRSTMDQCIGCRRDPFWPRRSTFMSEAEYTAHND